MSIGRVGIGGPFASIIPPITTPYAVNITEVMEWGFSPPAGVTTMVVAVAGVILDRLKSTKSTREAQG